MKVCYLYLSGFSPEKSGVDNKVIGKCIELEKMFPGSKFVRFSEQKQRSNGDFFSLISYNHNNKRFFGSFYRRKDLYAAVMNFVDQNQNNFDFFIVRYPFANFHLLKLLKKFPKKIIFEHNTNEREELKVIVSGNKKKIPFSLRPSVLSYYIESIWFTSFIERKIGKKCLGYAAGGIAVTPEIERIEREIFSSYKTIVITNGIEPMFSSLRKREGNVLNGVFLAGTYASWNGIERIVDSYLQSNVKGRVNLFFVGRIEENLKKRYAPYVNEGITFIDYIKKEDLSNFLEKMHFAIGTCAIHKKGLKQGAVLKVRDYLVNGLPVILGHEDPFIRSVPDLDKYCLHFPADDSKIDFDLIELRLEMLYKNDSNLNLHIQRAANQYLSWESVLTPITDFLAQLK